MILNVFRIRIFVIIIIIIIIPSILSHIYTHFRVLRMSAELSYVTILGM